MRFCAHVQIFRTKIEKIGLPSYFVRKIAATLRRLSSDLLPHAFSAIVCLNSKFPPPVELCCVMLCYGKIKIFLNWEFL
jgi:hypothetical protein